MCYSPVVTVVILALLGFQPSPLSEHHRVWLAEEVHFLISSEERGSFVALETDAARDNFIDAFWALRDREDHAARIRTSDRLFGVRGRHSARGRVYQLLGPPTFREDYTHAGARLFPAELWHYTGVAQPYLPDAFYLVFFKPGGTAPFRLWHPEGDGVAGLVVAPEPGRWQHGASIDEVDAIDAELALALKELVPGGGRAQSVSLLANLEGFHDIVARARRMGARVETSASLRRLKAHFVARVFHDDAGVPEIHHVLELDLDENVHLPWKRNDGRWHTRFALTGRLLDSARELERWEDTIQLDVTDAERDALKSTTLSFQGRRFLPPEAHRIELAVVAENGSSAVGKTTVGRSLPPLPLLARRIQRVEASRRLPFLVGNRLVLPWPASVLRGPELFAVTEIAAPARGTPFVWEIRRDGELEFTEERILHGQNPTLVTTAIKLNAPGGRYRVRALYGDRARAIDFEVGSGPDAASVRVLARESTPSEESRYRWARGRAFWGRGLGALALRELESALALDPDNVAAAKALEGMRSAAR